MPAAPLPGLLADSPLSEPIPPEATIDQIQAFVSEAGLLDDAEWKIDDADLLAADLASPNVNAADPGVASSMMCNVMICNVTM